MQTGTDLDRARAIRLRAYLGRVRDVRRTFRVPADADIAATLKRAALAALPKGEGWHLLVLSFERTSETEVLAPVLDRLARRHMGEVDFTAALAATLDGARAVLAVGARDAKRLERVRTALVGTGPA
jgi:hypothetical protein